MGRCYIVVVAVGIFCVAVFRSVFRNVPMYIPYLSPLSVRLSVCLSVCLGTPPTGDLTNVMFVAWPLLIFNAFAWSRQECSAQAARPHVTCS